MTRAKRGDGKTLPAPEQRAALKIDRRFTADEAERIAQGLVPETMDDKWFIHQEDGWVYFHRSWTGVCVYGMRLAPDGDGVRVAEAWASRDPEQYKNTEDEYDAEFLIQWLVGNFLLGQDNPLPRQKKPPWAA